MFNTEDLKIYKILIFLVMLYMTCDLTANLVVYKIVYFGLGYFPGGLFIVPILYALNCVITEIFGYRVTCIVIWCDLFCDYTFMLLIYIVLRLPHASVWHNQGSFDIVFDPLFQINIASSAGIVMGNILNAYLLARFKILVKGKYFWLRSISSSLIGEALVVLVAIPLGCMGVYKFNFIEKIMLSDYMLRIVYAIILAYPTNMLVNYLKKITGLDAYDYRISFNPFHLRNNKILV